MIILTSTICNLVQKWGAYFRKNTVLLSNNYYFIILLLIITYFLHHIYLIAIVPSYIILHYHYYISFCIVFQIYLKLITSLLLRLTVPKLFFNILVLSVNLLS